MNDSWSSEASSEGATAEQRPVDDAPEPAATPRRSDRHEAADPAADPAGRRERYPWVGLVFLLSGLGAGGAGLATIALELDRPGVLEVASERWWLVVGGGLAIAWSAPWFLRSRGRARMAIALGVCTAAVLAVAAVAIGSVGS